MQIQNRITLASSSPRRKALLEEAGLTFSICPADIDEDIRKGESPREHTIRLAEEKAQVVAKKTNDSWIIGADTIVFIDNQILGKPSDINEARKMLNLLSGRYHTVVTAFCILNVSTGKTVKKAVESKVKIKKLADKEIEDYLKTGEPLDKAGAYAVQGVGNFMIEEIGGSYTNVVGLPMEELKDALKKVGIVKM
ncbi:MAG: septum formation protein Maf [Deltaproteobacteria bacterium GWC2_42_51]|nr:MAG: septum formation protein Maf [Deltaproteobacteria bacterium GWA2_42_85]OGP30882.1 MAG: septum formation protein Maf [Deltaproteobacteria bacterium GWB2_42_7]OGP36902.1 MAG: septum formation protein Maf [Deltaproteobacteria bacterium GWC2_42_51]OGP38387.1 MAG: septum formation protein Maf [Deltaproteobacteria bacterium GWD2_42_10]OGP48997.1 MAG: septum formation protein Maf [Deltaproteobacteria bacterium GWF2_42_12]OGQ25639.1 MAG: septum formation protein Maf [Deltaproteobacteria bacter